MRGNRRGDRRGEGYEIEGEELTEEKESRGEKEKKEKKYLVLHLLTVTLHATLCKKCMMTARQEWFCDGSFSMSPRMHVSLSSSLSISIHKKLINE